jgi:hypothetical protein
MSVFRLLIGTYKCYYKDYNISVGEIYVFIVLLI